MTGGRSGTATVVIGAILVCSGVGATSSGRIITDTLECALEAGDRGSRGGRLLLATGQLKATRDPVAAASNASSATGGGGGADKARSGRSGSSSGRRASPGQEAALLVLALLKGDASSQTALMVLGAAIVTLLILAALFFLGRSTNEEVESRTPRIQPPQHQRQQRDACTAGHVGSRRAGHSILGQLAPVSALLRQAAGPRASSPPEEGDVLCPTLVVREADGEALSVEGWMAPFRQEGLVEITKIHNSSRGRLMQAVMAENQKDCGIVLDDGYGYPLIYLDTSQAVSSRGSPPPAGHRFVAICRPSADSIAESPTTRPFAIVETDEKRGTGWFVVRRAGEPSSILLRGHGDNHGFTFSKVGGGLLATTNRYTGSDLKERSSRVLQVAQGGDAGLIISTLIAAIKLR
mmetsp:Transcript_130537/g.279001  ORF Transcript_130537/g.279001 Transcript_130537/m.279001 type:complete len:407 (+) Transcript_130537:134-1354(+)